MKKIMFNDRYNLTQLVLQRYKTRTVRIENLEKNSPYETFIPHYPAGEIVAIAQSYRDVFGPDEKFLLELSEKEKKGWNNKMFVKACHMPRHIMIHSVDIMPVQVYATNEQNCLEEGIKGVPDEIKDLLPNYWHYDGENAKYFHTPQQAFESLFDSIVGKGAFARNPLVVTYKFELL